MPERKSVSIGSPSRAVIRNQVDAGPPKSRPRSTSVTRPVSCSYKPVGEVELVQFEEWYSEVLKMGSLSFILPHPVYEEPVSVMFAGEDGHYEITQIGKDAYQISVNLELI